MAKTVAFDVEVDSGSSVKTLAGLKTQLEQINEQLEQAEIGSKAFTELSDKARNTASEIKTLEKTFEGLEPQQKTEAFLKGFEAISGAVAVTAGTMALFGAESETIGKIEEKVQGAIAIAIGARAIAEGALQAQIAARIIAERTAAVATKAATIAQAAFNVVMNANPIFLLVTVLAAVTAGIYAFTKAMSSNTDETEANTQAQLRRNQQLEKSANFQLRIANATGQSAEQIKQLEIEANDALIKRLESESKLAKTAEDRTKINDELQKALDNEIILNLELGQVRQKEADDEKKRREEQSKQRIELQKKEEEEFQRKRKEAIAQQEADGLMYIKWRSDAFKKAQENLSNELQKSEDALNKKLSDNAVKRVSTIKPFVEDTRTETEKALDTIGAYAENIDLRVKTFLNSSAAQTVQGVAQVGNQLFSTLRETVDESNKEGFEKSKKYKIGQVVTTSTQAAFEAFASAQKLNGTVPGLGTILGAALVAAIIASSKKAITDIQNSKFEGGGSPSSPVVGSGGGGAATIGAQGSFIPIGQQPAGTQLTPSFQAGAPQPIPAYVIAGDVENGLEAEARLRNRRRLGPG
jgi:hypothetical protein